MLAIPLNAVPSQNLNVTLDGQLCQLSVYQKNSGLYINVSINNVLIIGGVLCLDRNRIVRDAYLGFVGDLGFIDTQGTNDPTYDGLGDRYQLIYLEAADLAAAATG